MGNSVQPCKIAPHLHPCARVAFGGQPGPVSIQPAQYSLSYSQGRELEHHVGRQGARGGESALTSPRTCEQGRYDLLPITDDMEWVYTSEGMVLLCTDN